MPRKMLLRSGSLLCATLVLAGMAGTVAPAYAAMRPQQVAVHLQRLVELTRTVVDRYIVRSSPADEQYWSDGSFIAADGVPCWYCYDAAATASAVLSEEGRGDMRLRQVAIATFTHAIHHYQLSSGEIVADDGQPSGVGTSFFVVELGVTYLELRDQLDPVTRKEWVGALRRAADWLIDTGQTTFYINGNVNLRQTEDLWLAWAATGDKRFFAAYQSEWQFTLAPPMPRWLGYGLHFTTVPTKLDGSNGAAYLAESDGDTPGYDPSYTMAQLDTATSLFVLTRNPRYVWLMNLLFNQLRPRVQSDFVLNAYGGSRKNDLVPFLTAAPAVFMVAGRRPDLTDFWLGQLQAIHSQYHAALSFASTSFYRGTSSWLSLPVLAVQWPHGILKASCSAQRSVVCGRLF